MRSAKYWGPVVISSRSHGQLIGVGLVTEPLISNPFDDSWLTRPVDDALIRLGDEALDEEVDSAPGDAHGALIGEARGILADKAHGGPVNSALDAILGGLANATVGEPDDEALGKLIAEKPGELAEVAHRTTVDEVLVRAPAAALWWQMKSLYGLLHLFEKWRYMGNDITGGNARNGAATGTKQTMDMAGPGSCFTYRPAEASTKYQTMVQTISM